MRAAFRAHCPSDTELYDLWMRRGWVAMKSQLRMKFDGMYYDAREEKAPNVMLYRGEEAVRERAWWGEGQVVREFDDE